MKKLSSKFRPGVFSPQLKAALHLSGLCTLLYNTILSRSCPFLGSMLPSFILRMRDIGYPPGYRADAKHTSSDDVIVIHGEGWLERAVNPLFRPLSCNISERGLPTIVFFNNECDHWALLSSYSNTNVSPTAQCADIALPFIY